MLLNITNESTRKMNNLEWMLEAWDLGSGERQMLPVRAVDIYFWTVESAQQMLATLQTSTDIQSILIDGRVQKCTSIESNMNVNRLEGDSSPRAVINLPQRLTNTADLPLPPSAGPSHSIAFTYNPAAPAATEAVLYRDKSPPPADTDAPFNATLAYQAPIASTSMVPSYDVTQLSRKQFAQAPRDDGHYFELPPPPPLAQPVFLQPAPKTPPSRQLLSFDAPPTAQLTTPQHLSTLFSPPSEVYTTASGLKLRSPSQTDAEFPSPQFATYKTPTSSPAPPPIRSLQGTPDHLHQYKQAQMYSPNSHGIVQAHTSPGYMPSPGLLPGFGAQPLYGTSSTSSFSHGSPALVSPYNIHSQAYRPTEAELGAHTSGKKQAEGLMGRVDSTSDRLEKKVGNFLKRLDKRL
jgi:hypothetical protein